MEYLGVDRKIILKLMLKMCVILNRNECGSGYGSVACCCENYIDSLHHRSPFVITDTSTDQQVALRRLTSVCSLDDAESADTIRT